MAEKNKKSKKEDALSTKKIKSIAKKVAKKETKIGKKSVKKEEKLQEKKESTDVQLSPQKQEIIEKFQIKSGDTGSPEVQVALLSSRIDKLVSHLKGNPSDNHSRRGLLGIVSKRRRLLHYLEKKDMKRYRDVAKKVGLAK